MTAIEAPNAFSFRVLGRDGAARTGEIATPRGLVRTPAFMPVGTAAAVKAMYPDEVRALGADILLGNTYHLMLRPSAERIARLGGLHTFMGWPGPILTDSGGFQVMSLSPLRKLDADGVTFRSHIDGSEHRLTPERSIEIQGLLGADIQMQFDECLRLPASREEMRRAMELSLRWGERSLEAFKGRRSGQALFGIVQGGDAADLRAESAKALAAMDFDGLAVGGLAVGEPQAVMLAMIEEVEPYLPTNKPRYLMGVGTPDDILAAVERGIDMFDCVMPTRAGRHATAYTRFGRINLRNARHADDPRPLDTGAACEPARRWSRAYLHHLVQSGESLAGMILTAINIGYYQELMAGIRSAIAAGRFAEFCVETRQGWAQGDLPPLQP